MIEIRSILAPTDFSPHAEAAVRYACGLAERFGARLHLFHALSDFIPSGPEPMLTPVLPPEYYRDTEQASLVALGTVLQPAWGTPGSVETSVSWGPAESLIIEKARTLKVDLVVISTHGRTGLSHVLLGSVAERIVRESPCPVLTIRDRN